MVNSVGDALDGFRDLPDEECEILKNHTGGPLAAT
jgi:hypothetical protein